MQLLRILKLIKLHAIISDLQFISIPPILSQANKYIAPRVTFRWNRRQMKRTNHIFTNYKRGIFSFDFQCSLSSTHTCFELKTLSHTFCSKIIQLFLLFPVLYVNFTCFLQTLSKHCCYCFTVGVHSLLSKCFALFWKKKKIFSQWVLGPSKIKIFLLNYPLIPFFNRWNMSIDSSCTFAIIQWKRNVMRQKKEIESKWEKNEKKK